MMTHPSGSVGFARANGRDGSFLVLATVTPDDCGSIEVGIAKSFDECVTTLADYYEKNPPQWVRRSAGSYEKERLCTQTCG